MSITVTCQCGKKLQSRDEHAGMRAKCPACGAVLLIPKPAAQAAPPAATAATEAKPAMKPAVKAQPAAPPSPPAAPRPLYEGKPLADWLETLRSSDADQRRKATEILGKVGLEARCELPQLIERLQADHVLVRHWAITCLKQLGPAAADAVEPLLGRFSDEQALIREQAARALAVVVPGGDRFLPRLLTGLNEKKPEARQAAIDCFRRDLRTAGISRRRFWMCSCGSVFEKENLEGQLKELGGGTSTPAWQGMRQCKKCGKQYVTADVFAGKHDVPDKYRAKLAARYGDRVDLPDDLLTDKPAEDLGYQIQVGPSVVESTDSGPLVTPLSIQVTGITNPDAAEGYAMSEPAYKPGQEKMPQEEPAEEEGLVPGAKVPKTGRYRCTACRKVRLSDSRSAKGGAAAAAAKEPEPKQSVVKPFKAGKVFTECPNCGDLTEWELLNE